MSLSAKVRRAPLRAVSGAFILQAGLGKFKADEGTAKQLHGMATGTYGFLGKLDPQTFTRVLAAGEVGLGSAILLPIVPPAAAGLGIMAFSGALLNLWWNTEGMHQPGKPLPTPQGTGVAKDVWLFGMGTGLLADALLEPAHDKKVEIGATVSEKRSARARRGRRKAAKKAAKSAVSSDKDFAKQVREAAKQVQRETSKRAAKAAVQAQKQAAKAAAKAGKQLADAREQYGPVVAEKAKQARDVAKDAVDQYGPVVTDKAKQARDAARDAVDQYGPVAAERAKQARDAAQLAADRARLAADRARSAAHAANAAAAAS